MAGAIDVFSRREVISTYPFPYGEREKLFLYEENMKGKDIPPDVCKRLGLHYCFLGEYKKAESYFKQFLASFKDSNKGPEAISGRVEGRICLGITYSSAGQYDKAIRCFRRCLKGATEENKVSVYGNLGVVYYNKKEYQVALQHLKSCLEKACKCKLKRAERSVWHFRHIIYQDLGEDKKAQKAWEKCRCLLSEDAGA